MKALRMGVFFAVLAGVAAMLIRGARENTRLRSEVERLRPASHAIDELRRKNRDLALATLGRGDHAKAEHEELVRLRGQVSAWRGQIDSVVRQQASPVRGAEPAGNLPPTVAPPPWQNVGRATPAFALQTGLWAQAHGDVNAMMDSFVCDEDGRGKLTALFAAQSEAERARYGTPERMAAMLAIEATAGQTGSWPPTQIVERPEGAENAEVVLRVHVKDGLDREVTHHARRFPDGWRIVLSPQQFEMLGNALSSLPPTQRLMLGQR